ncbi:unnamed protein product [Clonostachys chloroleuca]|uniref:Lid2 complex component snt2 n=1 Tax=Clonostachys chloroleuca TaxID=1926264 RepID=A0AA35LSY6_9HYPO|nr:unnamed protein product [Clonostachys chloroleuca]
MAWFTALMAQQNDSKLNEADGKSASEQMSGSSGQDALDKDAAAEMAAPYGTRSRNRPRPNYAEDNYDVEMYDYDAEKNQNDTKRPSRQSNGASHGENGRANAASRKSLGDDAKAGSSQNGGGSKEQTSSGGGTGTPQATHASSSTTTNASSQPSRKRKAGNAANQQTKETAVSSTRKTGNSAQTSSTSYPESNVLTFSNCKARPQNGRLVADDGTVLEANDHVYLVCEPPGEPYYLGRIMEFLHPQNDTSKPVDALRINWFYRPRDIGRKVHDTRIVFATMHSDISPLTALRGKCQIRHRVEIKNMDEYRRTPDNFWFEKLYDRYIQKNYDLIPTSGIVNVPEKVKKVLDERWKFVLVEQGRGKELTSAVKSCKRCTGYCASNDSVDCAVCQQTYHMNCVKPPLLKKPSRGFAWSCAACSRAQERKLEARHTPHLAADGDDDELLEDDEDDIQIGGTGGTTPAEDAEHHHQGTAEQIYQASLWPWRYLGMHCKPEDALDYDDRIYPRASTRIGPRHQANVGPWPGRPVQYIKPPETRRGGRKDAKANREAQAAQIADLYPDGKRPKWVQDMPPGYTSRGEDYVDPNDPNATSALLWKPPTSEETAQKSLDYMGEAKGQADKLGLPKRSTNLQDIALNCLFKDKYNPEKAMKDLASTDIKLFKEPSPSANELKKFEEGVAKYGSELHLVMKHVKTMTPGQVVRFYYTWKKSDRGKPVWGSYPGRKGKKEAKKAEALTKVADDVAHDDDDSAFDSRKASEKKRAFMCQFCSSTSSRRWRRAPNATPGLVNENGVKATGKDKGSQYVIALCSRCAELWRRYAIRWEDIDEVAKKVAQSGGKAWKRKQDEELLKELQTVKEMGLLAPEPPLEIANGTPTANGGEPPRKKLKGAAPEKETDSDGGSTPGAVVPKKKEKVSEKTSETSPLPEMPKPRTLPCAICAQIEPLDNHLSCRECRLPVHRKCYGVLDTAKSLNKWTCDMCTNDKNPQVSIQYKCVLCPVELTEHDFVEQPKLTHHKKKMSEKDREREKLEVQQARKAAEFYRKKQEELNRPVNPREALKRTADNNWVHVTCAVWTPEVRFGNAKALMPSEGIPSIPRARYDETCMACNDRGGACVFCPQCRLSFHVECARKQDHILGFEITPVKSSKRDQHNIVSIQGESGTMTATLWCKDHGSTKPTVHQMHEEVDPGDSNESLNLLQFYVQNYKQADLALTGTVRKANLMTTAAKMSGTLMQPGARRASTIQPVNGGTSHARNGEAAVSSTESQPAGEKVCISCGIDVSPKWWATNISQERELTNGHYGSLGDEAKKFVEQRKFQCHKCRKTNRTPKTHHPQPTSLVAEPARPPPIESGYPNSMTPLRSPAPLYAESRDVRAPYHQVWSQSPPSHPTHPFAAPGPAGRLVRIGDSRPPLAPPGYPPPPSSSTIPPAGPVAPPPPIQPPRGLFGDWGPRPGNPPGPPSQHLSSGPPSLAGGPPLNTMSSLRPPPMAVSPPPPPPGPLHQPAPHGHGAQPYVNGLPPSPRRGAGPPPQPQYSTPYAPAPVPGPPRHHGPPHGLSNGVPPHRPEPYQPGLTPPRPPFSGPHGSPLGVGHTLPPPQESAPIGHHPPRNGPESRPTSGASASPSLRNLLS